MDNCRFPIIIFFIGLIVSVLTVFQLEDEMDEPLTDIQILITPPADAEEIDLWKSN